MNNSQNILILPDEILSDEDGQIVSLDLKEAVLSAFLDAGNLPIKEVSLIWKDIMKDAGKLLADTWERAYGDLFWKCRCESHVMPWYFIDDRGECIIGFGVKVRPGAMCYWEIRGNDLVLHLDVRNGSEAVMLKGRVLKMADIIMRKYEDTDPFTAAHDFCEALCDDPLFPDAPLYGCNNWYYAYGISSRDDILRDCEYLKYMTEGIANRPFMVIDDGWQMAHTPSYNGGPWNSGNRDYGDMARMASDMKKLDVRPGIWFRPLLDISDDIPSGWRSERDDNVLDISVPEVIDHVKKDVCRIRDWGFELIKHDFSTYDIFGMWGFEMGTDLTKDKWRFKDTSRTTAEIITDCYRAIRDAAGDMLILGCNCIGHLGAGLMEANRTGDDTSGIEWERTRKMGINTLAFRMPQHGAFFAADADCAALTDKIPWEKSRQWLELLSISATPFFVSVRPGTLTPDMEIELRAAYKRASHNQTPAVPLDWKEEITPAKWNTFEGIKEYNW